MLQRGKPWILDHQKDFNKTQGKHAQEDTVTHFPVLGFTVSTWEPLLFWFNLTVMEVEYGWLQILNVFADWVRNEHELKANIGGEGN